MSDVTETPGSALPRPPAPDAAAAPPPASTAPAPPDTPPASGPWLPALVVALVGFTISLDLLLRTLALMSDHVPGGFDVCTAIFKASCDRTLMTSQSWRFGMPAAGWGMAYFAALAWLIFLARTMGGWFAPRAAAAGLLLVAPGVLVSIALGTALLMGRVPMCPLCLLVHAVNLLLAFLVWRAGRFPSGGLARMFAGGLRWAVGPPGREPPEARWTVFGVLSAAMVGFMVFQWSAAQVERHGGAAMVFDPLRVVREFEAVTPVEIPVSDDDARLGPADAPARLVVFSDFECPGCSELAPEMAAIAARLGDHVSVTFKHYPLSTECNRFALDDRHPGACRIAAASEAARRQGKFWPFHDLAFENTDGAADSVLARMASAAGLDRARFARDLADTTSMARVRADIELADRLRIQGTPTVFLNGRKLPELSRQSLELLVDRAVLDDGHGH